MICQKGSCCCPINAADLIHRPLSRPLYTLSKISPFLSFFSLCCSSSSLAIIHLRIACAGENKEEKQRHVLRDPHRSIYMHPLSTSSFSLFAFDSPYYCLFPSLWYCIEIRPAAGWHRPATLEITETKAGGTIKSMQALLDACVWPTLAPTDAMMVW